MGSVHSSLFWNRMCRIDVTQFLMLIKFAVKSSGPGDFFSRKSWATNSISLIVTGLIRLPISSWVTFGSLRFFEKIDPFYLIYPIYKHIVVHNISSYPFNICGQSDSPPFIPDIGNLCFLFSPLSFFRHLSIMLIFSQN